MKKLSYFLSASILLSILLSVGCKPNDTPGLSEEEQQKALLTKSWGVSTVTLGGEGDVTAGFTDFVLTVESTFSYTSTGATRTPQPWPGSGTFAFDLNTDGTANVNKILREAGSPNELPMTLQMNADGSAMTLSFTFTEGTHTSGGGRTEAISGAWVFDFIAK
ncbi:MAG: hypothetical protein OEX22_00565 [Cyclobacteriaceae bacterium]|nr:hypothetical protein [Cyclobacteriaceae bacterium]